MPQKLSTITTEQEHKPKTSKKVIYKLNDKENFALEKAIFKLSELSISDSSLKNIIEPLMKLKEKQIIKTPSEHPANTENGFFTKKFPATEKSKKLFSKIKEKTTLPEDVNEKLSISDIRKMVKIYLEENNLYDKENKARKLDKFMKDLCNVTESQFEYADWRKKEYDIAKHLISWKKISKK